MRSRDEVLREFDADGVTYPVDVVDDMADRIRELEAENATMKHGIVQSALKFAFTEEQTPEAASEPVAWVYVTWRGYTEVTTDKDRAELLNESGDPIPLYAHPSVSPPSGDRGPADLAAGVTVTEAMVNAAARRGRDYGFNAYCDNAQEYWAAMESVVTAALTHPTTPTRGSDE